MSSQLQSLDTAMGGYINVLHSDIYIYIYIYTYIVVCIHMYIYIYTCIKIHLVFLGAADTIWQTRSPSS